MSDDLHALAAELAIQKLNARYCDAVHRRDSESWSSLWAEDATWDFMGQTITGRAPILAMWEGAMAGFPHVYHTSHAAVINVEGDTANCRWYINEEIIDANDQALRFVGVYNDVCSKVGDSWLYQHRAFSVLYQGPGGLNKEGWQPYPDAINTPPA